MTFIDKSHGMYVCNVHDWYGSMAFQDRVARHVLIAATTVKDFAT